MSLSVGIVGLPNVGKSTLFNALSSKQAEAANYAFCTIEPNVGVVPVPDPRFDALRKLVQPAKAQAAHVTFTDIAGLVKGASRGEGRGNAFLSHIRDCDAIVHVVRCFEDADIVHVEGKVDPVADAETIETELILRDMESLEKRSFKVQKLAKGGDANAKRASALIERLTAALDQGSLAAKVEVDEADQALVDEFGLLTRKPMFYVANVAEGELTDVEDNPRVSALRKRAAERDAPLVAISAAIEAEIMQLDEEERADYLDSLGLTEPGLDQVIRTGYTLLGLITFFTAGPKEVRAWTVTRGTRAPGAAGKIHTDFEKTFIRAEVIAMDDYLNLGGEVACKNAGKMMVQGKDYEMQDGDVVHFRVGASSK